MMKTSAQRLADKRVVELTDGRCALRVDVDQDVHPVLQVGSGSAHAACRNTAPCTFACSKNSPALTRARKSDLGQKVIIFAIDFAGARRASCAGNGINEIRRLAECITERRFSRAGWSRDDEKNPVAA